MGHHAYCTPESPCGEYEGDCDTDSDCQTGLRCGQSSCRSYFYKYKRDCCIGKIYSF